jgi:hypothetical protein
MKISHNQTISVSRLISTLIATGSPTAKQCLSNGITIGGEPISPHSFSLNESLNFLTYESQRDNDEVYLQQWQVISEASNLPNIKEGVRYYLLSNGKRISKLHLYAFSDCVCLFSRHEYKHLYRSQTYSTQQKGFKHHDYRRKIDNILKNKKRLVINYNGRRTRTAKKLDHYLEQEAYYDKLADNRLASFLGKYYK